MFMTDANDRVATLEEQSDEDRVFGLIAGMLDGHITQFEYKDVVVEREQTRISVRNKRGYQLGGFLHAEAVELHDVKEWVENKVKYSDKS